MKREKVQIITGISYQEDGSVIKLKKKTLKVGDVITICDCPSWDNDFKVKSKKIKLTQKMLDKISDCPN